MAKQRGLNYRVGAPIEQQGGSLRSYLVMVVLPLLIVGIYCSGYIAFRMHQQQVTTANIAHEHDNDSRSSASSLPVIELQNQTELTAVPVSPVSTTPSGNHTKYNQSLSGNDALWYLQNSSPNRGQITYSQPQTKHLDN